MATGEGSVAQRSALRPAQRTVLSALEVPAPPRFYDFTSAPELGEASSGARVVTRPLEAYEISCSPTCRFHQPCVSASGGTPGPRRLRRRGPGRWPPQRSRPGHRSSGATEVSRGRGPGGRGRAGAVVRPADVTCRWTDVGVGGGDERWPASPERRLRWSVSRGPVVPDLPTAVDGQAPMARPGRRAIGVSRSRRRCRGAHGRARSA